jgi:hypothetical protein
MIWFGSSAGVALASMYPEEECDRVGARKLACHARLRLAVMLAVLGWFPPKL